MDGTVLGIFEWLEVMADLSNIENCHWAKPSKGSKKVLWKLLDTKTSTTYFHRKRSEEYEFIITAYQLNGLQSTIGYVLITKFWRVNVGNLYIYILFGWQMVQSSEKLSKKSDSTLLLTETICRSCFLIMKFQLIKSRQLHFFKAMLRLYYKEVFQIYYSVLFF